MKLLLPLLLLVVFLSPLVARPLSVVCLSPLVTPFSGWSCCSLRRGGQERGQERGQEERPRLSRGHHCFFHVSSFDFSVLSFFASTELVRVDVSVVCVRASVHCTLLSAQ